MANTRVRSICPYCGVGCGIVMEVADNRVVKVTGDKAHPSNFGRLCTKGTTCGQAIAAPGRLERAQMRHADTLGQVAISMDAAISETAKRLRAILDTHGPDAISFYVSGQMSLESQYLANKLAKGYIRTKNIESNSRLCMASAGSGYKLSLGADGPPGSYQDFDHADVFFVIGANMADCHPILFLRMMDRVKAGAKLIVVDPRRNTTADKADLFLQIKPGTDLVLLNGLLYLLVENGQTDAAFIAEFTEGWEAMPAFLEDYPPATVAEITGLAEADIRLAANWIGQAKEWMTCWTMGLNQSTQGTWHTNAICNLHLATGKICRPGSGPFSLTGQPNAMGGREMGYMGAGLPGQRSLLVDADRDFVEKMWGLDADALRKESGGGAVSMFDDMKAGAIKACWIICTNPVASLPNRETVIEGLKAAELVVTQDVFLDTETNIYADIMLPGALWAEAEGIMVNSERTLTLMQKAVEPPGEVLPDWLIIARVAAEMGFADAFQYQSAAEVFEEIKRAWNPTTGYDLRGASYDRLRDAPVQWPCASETADSRNPIRYCNDGVSQTLRQTPAGGQAALVFATPSGKGVFFARPAMLPAELPDADFPFVLNTGRVQHQWHTLTKTGKIATLNKLNPGPFVELHPEDARALGIVDKDRVEIRSRRGHAILPAVVTDRVRPGGCFAPFHWNDVFGDDLAINAVTSDAVDPISLQPGFKFCAVALSRVDRPKREAETILDLSAPSGAAAVTGIAPKIAALAQMIGVTMSQIPTLEGAERLYMEGFLAGLGADTSLRGVPVLPPDAPIEPAKRIVLDGMLAGLFSRAPLPAGDAAHPSAESEESRIVVLWASQTGNAEAVAVRCAQRLQALGRTAKTICLDAYRPEDLAKAAIALLIVSTFGDGDPPDSGAGFWTALEGTNTPSLTQLQFAVLAFGDSNYAQFCGFGRKLDARLAQLGASRLLDRTDCEPDFEATVDAWFDRLATALASAPSKTVLAGHFDLPDAPDTTRSDRMRGSDGRVGAIFDRKNPYSSRIILNRLLNQAGSDKETRQYAFAIETNALPYDAGDALGVWPRNCPDLVADIIEAAGLDADEGVVVDGHGEMSVAAALAEHYEIARIAPPFLRWWADRAADQELAARLAVSDPAELEKWLWGRQIVDLLRAARVQLHASELLGALKRLQPRSYSISSSPKHDPNEVQTTVSTVRYLHGDQPRKGVCSTFLADRAGDGTVRLFIQKSPHFRPPKNPDVAMIMVGPGTGIAPFRAFLQDRQASGATGANWLFFGEQRAATDFYYRDELEQWTRTGHLAHLDLAFSRDQADKIYVQHRMMEQGARLWRWLEEGAHFYVCGDASRMAKDVDNALKAVLQAQGGLSADAAIDYVAQMSRDKRYQRDVY